MAGMSGQAPSREPPTSEYARRRAVAVARQINLPKGWLAERRSGGHYVIFSPDGARFTSITSAQKLSLIHI